MCVLETLVFAGEGVGDVVIDTVVTVTIAKWVCTLFGWVLYGFYLIFVLNAEFWKFNFVVGLHLSRKNIQYVFKYKRCI